MKYVVGPRPSPPLSPSSSSSQLPSTFHSCSLDVHQSDIPAHASEYFTMPELMSNSDDEERREDELLRHVYYDKLPWLQKYDVVTGPDFYRTNYSDELQFPKMQCYGGIKPQPFFGPISAILPKLDKYTDPQFMCFYNRHGNSIREGDTALPLERLRHVFEGLAGGKERNNDRHQLQLQNQVRVCLRGATTLQRDHAEGRRTGCWSRLGASSIGHHFSWSCPHLSAPGCDGYP